MHKYLNLYCLVYALFGHTKFGRLSWSFLTISLIQSFPFTGEENEMWTNYVIYSTSLRKFVAEQDHVPRAPSTTLCYFLGDFEERNVTQTSLTQTVVSGLPVLSVPALSYRAQNFQSFVICGFYHILSVGFPLLFPFPGHQLFAYKSYLDIYIE